MRPFRLLISYLAFLLMTQSAAGQHVAEWTVMVYLNGDNNLEPDALDDFAEMAKVALPANVNTPAVNVIVQFDRIGVHTKYRPTNPQWTQTLRFRMTRNIQPVPTAAYQDLGEKDMGDPATLTDFITDTRTRYPARKYALVIWDHGQGYRYVSLNRALAGIAEERSARTATSFKSSAEATYRSCSNDETNNNELFNAETQKALADALGAGQLDVIGFDACLMAMVETAYGLRPYAKYLVASQELEPGSGWQYDYFLGALMGRPAMTGRELSIEIVNAAQRRYDDSSIAPDPTVTLSVVDLSSMNDMAASITRFSDIAGSALPGDLAELKTARASCDVYAPGLSIHHVDAWRFFDRVAASQASTPLVNAAKAARDAIGSAVVAKWAGAKRTGNFGSNGLCIYFPATNRDYQTDPWAKNGYEKANAYHPVSFVRDQHWTEFLHAYWALVQE